MSKLQINDDLRVVFNPEKIKFGHVLVLLMSSCKEELIAAYITAMCSMVWSERRRDYLSVDEGFQILRQTWNSAEDFEAAAIEFSSEVGEFEKLSSIYGKEEA